MPSQRRREVRGTACVAAVAALAGCVRAAPPSAPEGAGDVPHRVYDARAGRFVGWDALLDDLAGAEVVFVGEQHDDAATHRLQRALLDALSRRRVEGVLGLEMFERDVQPALDRYLAGEIAEAEFLADARPWPNYAAAYRPLVELARERGWAVVATNVPRPLAAAVARQGLDTLAALSPAGRLQVAEEVVCPRDRYRERFAEEMGGHPAGGEAGPHGGAHGLDEGMLERLYAAQCLKDETMAESVVRALEASPGALVLHLNGAFHSDERLGIVPRVERRRPGTRIVVVSAVPVADPAGVDPEPHAEAGDYVLFTSAPRNERSPSAGGS